MLISQFIIPGHSITHKFWIFAQCGNDVVVDRESYTCFIPLWWWFSAPHHSPHICSDSQQNILYSEQRCLFGSLTVPLISWCFFSLVFLYMYGLASFWCSRMPDWVWYGFGPFYPGRRPASMSFLSDVSSWYNKMLVRICKATVWFSSWHCILHHTLSLELARMIRDELRFWVVAVIGRI